MERKWRVLTVVCIAVFMLLLDITVVNVALPNIQTELHTSFTDLQWVVDAYALTLAATILNAGSLGDLLGRKRVFLVSIALFTLASALCGAATSPLFLDLARGLQGIGGAGMFAVSLAIIAQEFHGKERGTAFGIWGATIGIAVAIGPSGRRRADDVRRLALDLLRQRPDRRRGRRSAGCASSWSRGTRRRAGSTCSASSR